MKNYITEFNEYSMKHNSVYPVFDTFTHVVTLKRCLTS